MTTETITTPRQAALTIETPYGTARIRDMRHYDTHPTEGDRADVHFEELTVNRKVYTNVSGTLSHRYGRYAVSFSYYQGLTDSARDKVSEFFCPNGECVIEELNPYTHEIDQEYIRQSLKSSIRSRALRGLSEAVD